MLNFIAFTICMIGGIASGIKGNDIVSCINIALAVINLPFMIKWVRG